MRLRHCPALINQAKLELEDGTLCTIKMKAKARINRKRTSPLCIDIEMLLSDPLFHQLDQNEQGIEQ
jgi:hypothetical protein